MKNFKFLLLALVAITAFSSCGYERIDAGHVGIRVNLYGDDKGVDDVTEVTGAQWYAPWKTQIFEFPTYVQNADYSDDEDSGDSFSVSSKDGLPIGIEAGINYRVLSDSVVPVFKKYRKPLDELESTILRKLVRKAFSDAAGNYTAENIYEKKRDFFQQAEDYVRNYLEPEGFIVEQVVPINDPHLPESVKENIEAKVNATQTALRKQEELAQAKADAAKMVEKARGDSLANVITAAGEAEAYKLKKRELNELLVQQQFIDKWDGKLPTYGEVPQLFRMISSK